MKHLMPLAAMLVTPSLDATVEQKLATFEGDYSQQAWEPKSAAMWPRLGGPRGRVRRWTPTDNARRSRAQIKYPRKRKGKGKGKGR